MLHPADDRDRRACAGLRIRRLGLADRSALAHHLLGLSAPDRVMRFNGAVTDDVIARHCALLDLRAGGRAIVVAALDRAAVIGAALACRTREDATVEVAVTVALEYQGRRLGERLATEACAAAAREQGATRAAFQLRPDDVAMHRLVRRLGGRITLSADLGIVPIGDEARLEALTGYKPFAWG